MQKAWLGLQMGLELCRDAGREETNFRLLILNYCVKKHVSILFHEVFSMLVKENGQNCWVAST